MNAADVIAAFASDMRQSGLVPPGNLIANGKIQRCAVEGANPRKRDGAYLLLIDERPAGGFGHHKGGWRWHKWRYANGSTTWSATERAAFDAERAARKKAAEQERLRLAEAAQREAVAMYGNSSDGKPTHPYLIKKEIKPHGIRQRGDDLLVPRHDMRTGELVNLQRILPNGDKLNLKGGRDGGTWHIIGKPQAQGTILLGEGFATCATSHEIVGHAAVVSFGSGNLQTSAAELRKQYPEAKIVVLADDDWKVKGNPGLTAAKEAALASGALMAVPKFGPDRGDKDTDFNDMRRLVGADAVRAAIKNAAKPPKGNDKAAADQPGDGGGRGPKQADVLIALSAEATLFHTADGTGFADLEVNGHRETWPIRRKDFRRWLVRRFYKETGGAPNSEALQAALNVIEAKAQFDGQECEVFIRVGEHGDKLYLDLCDDKWRAVEIDTDGWRIVTKPPLRFRRAAGMKPLPDPQRGGSIKKLRNFLNVASDNDFVLVEAWLLTALRGRGPYPVLALAGEQGTGKSLLVAILRSLVDPNTAALRSLPREERDLFIAATNGHVLAFDNVSGLPAWLSDALCRIATGAAFATRQNYTDTDEVLLAACQPIILNGIEDIVGRSDLADRAIFLTLPLIAEDKRRTEAELWAAFETERPLILGALLDAVAEGLKRLPETRLERPPRMADFATWASACETALGETGAFMKAYSENIGGAVDAVIDADPVADAVRTIMTTKREQPKWEGTAAELLITLAEQAGDRIAKSKSWPESARAMSGRLRRAATGLRKIGIEIGFGRKARTRTISITAPNNPRPEGEGDFASSPSSPSSALPKSKPINDLATPDPMTQNPAMTQTPSAQIFASSQKASQNGHDDGDDANDANSPTPSNPRVERRI